jgi:cytochrome c-type biogenesis protein CcmF
VFILALLALVSGGSLLLFALRAPVMSATGLFAPVSREGALVLNNILLCSICAVVLTGTTYPLFAELLFGAKISVGPPYFQAAVFPLAVPLFLAMSLGPVLPWKRAELLPALLKLWWAALIAAIVGTAAALGVHAGFAAAGFAASAWLIFGSLAELVERTRLFRAPFATFRSRVVAQPLSVWGSAVAHAGMGVTVAGIAGMSLAASTIVAVHPGESVQLGGYDWQLLALHDEQGPNYAARVADIRVISGGREVVTFHPSRRMFTVQKSSVTDTAIQTNGLRDLYAVLGEERDGAAVLRLHVNPLAPWIWFGALVMAAGGALSLADRRLRIGAPARRAVGMKAGVVS